MHLESNEKALKVIPFFFLKYHFFEKKKKWKSKMKSIIFWRMLMKLKKILNIKSHQYLGLTLCKIK